MIYFVSSLVNNFMYEVEFFSLSNHFFFSDFFSLSDPFIFHPMRGTWDCE